MKFLGAPFKGINKAVKGVAKVTSMPFRKKTSPMGGGMKNAMKKRMLE